MSDKFPGLTVVLGRMAWSGKNKNETIAAWLGRQIVSGKFASGQRISKEIDFLEETGMSRGAYRKALRRLAGQGMLVTRTRSSTQVTPRES